MKTTLAFFALAALAGCTTPSQTDFANALAAGSQGMYASAATYQPPLRCVSHAGGTWVGSTSTVTTTCY